jgi:hypothetical protein
MLELSIGTKPRWRYTLLLCFFLCSCDLRGSLKVSRSMRIQIESHGTDDRSFLGSRLAKSQDGDILCFCVSFFCFDNATVEGCRRSRLGGGYKRFLELTMKDTLWNARLADVEACFAFAFAFAFMLAGWVMDVAQGRMVVLIANRTFMDSLHHKRLVYH